MRNGGGGGVLLKSNTLFQIPFSPDSLFLHSHKTRRSLSSIQLPRLPFHVKLPSLSSSKTPTQSMPTTEETFDFEDEDEEFEDEDEDIIVPLSNMRQWTRNKPRGFGEGKVYDTSVEDKLLEDLEQSRVAQLANINNLKNNPVDGNPNSSKKEKLTKHKESEVVPNGTRVRLVNLPKKKNIHRDLQAAFKSFTGIINIIPAVSGNEKTREPVCKGFAFVDFKSHKEANRFVDIISTQPLTFGKVQKQIRCEIMKPNPASVDRIESPLPVSFPVTETPYVEDDDVLRIGDDELVLATNEDEAGSEPLKKQKEVREKGKKKTTRPEKKAPKLSILGSAKRLKMKEKALLSGVFSKYGAKSTD